MYRIGLTSGGAVVNDCEALFKNFKEGGIDAVEISVAPDRYADLDYKRIAAAAKEYEMELWSFHLPFSPFPVLDISKKELAKDSVTYLQELINKASYLGIDKFIIHPSGEPIEPEDRAERMKISKESLAILAETARCNGAVIAVEDLPRTCLGNCSADIEELISVDPNLFVCFDTNHLLGEDPVDFVNRIGKKIITLHVSDYDFVNERHWLPGEGKNDWQAIYKALQEIEYNGVWLYELGFGSTKKITRERPLTCEDFVRNAREIFEGRELTVVPGQTHV